MKLKLTAQFVLTFLLLIFLLHEAHEIVHTSTGRITCGCWGARDFNVWDVCSGCSEASPYSVIATFAGPVFTFAMMWIGVFLMGTKRSNRQKALGFSLVFADMPFARFFGAATGGGDEVWGLNQILKDHTLAWIIGVIIVLTIIIYPLYKGFKLIKNDSPIVWFLVFLLIPHQVDHWVVLIIMNTILEKGVLSNYWIMGSPLLVTVWTIGITGLFFLTGKNIYTLVDNNANETRKGLD